MAPPVRSRTPRRPGSAEQQLAATACFPPQGLNAAGGAIGQGGIPSGKIRLPPFPHVRSSVYVRRKAVPRVDVRPDRTRASGGSGVARTPDGAPSRPAAPLRQRPPAPLGAGSL